MKRVVWLLTICTSMFFLGDMHGDTSGISTSEFSFILKPSTLEGVGLFATHAIPKGSILYRVRKTTEVRKMKEVHPDFLKYCVFLNDDECRCPRDFTILSVWCFINHSKQPNVMIRKHDRAYVACRDINAGDELFMDYNDFDEPELLKEGYYKK